jgi:hypothetical protein
LVKLVWIVVFHLWRVFSVCGHLVFLSFFEVEVLPDLVLLFLLSSACNLSPSSKRDKSSLFVKPVPCPNTPSH